MIKKFFTDLGALIGIGLIFLVTAAYLLAPLAFIAVIIWAIIKLTSQVYTYILIWYKQKSTKMDNYKRAIKECCINCFGGMSCQFDFKGCCHEIEKCPKVTCKKSVHGKENHICFNCFMCGYHQGYDDDGTHNGITEEEAQDIGWTKIAKEWKWLCPKCNGNEGALVKIFDKVQKKVYCIFFLIYNSTYKL